MRAIFMGTDRFAVPVLEAIIDSEAELLCVITQPDRPSGRKLKLTPSPIKEVALGHGLTIYQPKRVREKEFVDDVLRKLAPDVVVVTAFGQILPEEILNLPPQGCINLHPSLLPKYRGAAPIQRAIMNGETETGVTVMFMDVGEDTGDIIIQEKIPIELSDSSEIMSQKLSDLAAELTLKALRLAQKGTLPRQVQDEREVSYAPKLSKEDGHIDWAKSALEIHNLIRGTIPWPGAYTTFGESKPLKIWESHLTGTPSGDPPGTIIEVLADGGILVATGDGELLITTVQPASKARMIARDFANGYRLKAGDAFL